MVVSPLGLWTKNHYTGNGQQQFSNRSEGLIVFRKTVVVLRNKTKCVLCWRNALLRNVNEIGGTYNYCCALNVLSCAVKCSLRRENKTYVIKRNEMKHRMCKVRYAISTLALLVLCFTSRQFDLAFILPVYSGPWWSMKVNYNECNL
jgi:hypothetical protein